MKRFHVVVAYPEERPMQVSPIIQSLKNQGIIADFCGTEGDLRELIIGDGNQNISVIVIDIGFAPGNPDTLHLTSYQGMSGIAICKWIRHILPNVPILVMMRDKERSHHITRINGPGLVVSVCRDSQPTDFSTAVVKIVDRLISHPETFPSQVKKSKK